MAEIVFVDKNNISNLIVKYSDSDIDLDSLNKAESTFAKDSANYSRKRNNGGIKPKNNNDKLVIAHTDHDNHFALERAKNLARERNNREDEIHKSARLCLTLNRDSEIAKFALKNNFSIARLDEPWKILWSDECNGLQYRVDQLSPYQRVNYFFSMRRLVLTHLYADYCLALRRLCPKLCDCFPWTWIMPREYLQLHEHIKANPKDKYVRKSIGVNRKERLLVFDLTADVARKSHRACVVQIYVQKPFLIDGMKFSVANFVLITACGSSLRVFVYSEGSVRFYSENNDPQNHEIGKISQLWEWLHKNGYDDDEIASRIDAAIVKTVIAINPHITSEMERKNISLDGNVCPCFQVIQINIMLDELLNPIVINMKDTPIVQDPELKERLFLDTITMCSVQNTRHFRAMVALGQYLNKMHRKRHMEQRVKEWIVESETKEREKRIMVEDTAKSAKQIQKETRQWTAEQRIGASEQKEEKTNQFTTVMIGNNKINDNPQKKSKKKKICERKESECKIGKEVQKVSKKLTERESQVTNEDKMMKMENEIIYKPIGHVKSKKVKFCVDNTGKKDKSMTQPTQFVRRYRIPTSYVEIMRRQRRMKLKNKIKLKNDKKNEAKNNEIENSELENSGKDESVTFGLIEQEDIQCNFKTRKQFLNCRNSALIQFNSLKRKQFRNLGDHQERTQDSPLRDQFEWETMNLGNFRLIYPSLDGDQYADVMDGAREISHFIQNYKGQCPFNVKYTRMK